MDTILSISSMKLSIDYRESSLYEKCLPLSATLSTPIELTVANLTLGDLSLLNDNGHELVLFERKSLTDLLASIKDGRYEEQSHRLIHSSGVHTHNIVYIIEGMISQLRNDKDRKLVFSAMTSLQYFKGFSVVRTCSVSETAEFVILMADKIGRDLKKGKQAAFRLDTGSSVTDGIPTETPLIVSEPAAAASATAAIPHYSSVVKKTKKENITSENIGELFLCQIPGVSSTIAVEIMRVFHGDFWELMKAVQENPERLNDIYLETNGKRRKLSKSVIANINTFLKKTSTTPLAENNAGEPDLTHLS